MSTPSRNSPCPCSSGLKFKKCCAEKQAAQVGFSGMLVAMPNRGSVCIETLMALRANMDNESYALMSLARLPIVEARNAIAGEITNGIQAGHFTKETPVLWADSDGWWPQGTVHRLKRALFTSGVALASGFYCARAPRLGPVAYRPDAAQIRPHVNCQFGEVVDAGRVGFHFVMHRAGLLMELGPDPFTIPVNSPPTDSEDFAFCDRVRRIGKRIVCDTGAWVAHIDPRDGAAYIPGEVPMRVQNNALVHPGAEHLYAGEIKRTELREYGLPDLENTLLGEKP